MFSYFSSITVWPLLLVSSTIIFSSSGSRTWGADSLREPVVKINYIMSKSQILLGHFKDDYFIHCMTDLHDQGVSLSIFPFPPHTSYQQIFLHLKPQPCKNNKKLSDIPILLLPLSSSVTDGDCYTVQQTVHHATISRNIHHSWLKETDVFK